MAETFELVIKGNSKEAVAALKQVQNQFKKNEDQAKKNTNVLKNFKANWLIITAAMAGSIKFFKGATSAAAEQQRQQETLAAAMKQAGTFTQEAFESNLKYASSLQKMTKFGDEAIIGVQKMLTNFGVEGKMLDKLTKSTLDLATAKGMDLKSAGDLVAKSVGSSTNALTRYGIEVTGAVGSTERMNQAVENITKLFGGAAQAEAKTFSGAVQQMKNVMGDASEAIGALLFPVLMPFVNILKKSASFIAENEAAAAAMIGTVVGLTVAVIGLKLGLFAAAAAATGLSAALVASGIGAIIALIAVGAILIIKNWDKVKIFMENAWLSIKFAALKAWAAIKIGALTAARFMISAVDLIIKPYTFLFDFIIKGMNKVFKTNIKQISEFKDNWIDGIDKQIKAEKVKNKTILLDGLKTYDKLSDGAKKMSDSLVSTSEEAADKMVGATAKISSGIKKGLETVATMNTEIVGRIADIQNSTIERSIEKQEEKAERDKEALDAEFELKIDNMNRTLNAQEQIELKKETKDDAKAKIKEKFNNKRRKAEEKLTADKARKEEEIEKRKERAIAQARVKQFRLSKATGIIEAIINTAGGIARALVSPGGIAGVVMAVIIGALGAAQIGIIASQQAPSVPSFAEGAIVSRPTLATVGDNPVSPEVISPLHKLNEFLQPENQIIMENVTFQAASPRELFDMFLEMLDSMGIKTVARV